MADEFGRRMERVRTELAARVPLETYAIPVGEREWRLTAVHNQDALLDAAEQFAHFPYGFLLWESAVGLARFLHNRPERVQGKRVLELGAGVGMPGLIAQALGAQVWQTDHQAGALQLAQVNAWQNGVEGIAQFVADWRDWRRNETYDVLLGADILYEPAMHFHLESIFRHNLARGGCLLLSDPGRPQALEFAAHLEKHGWQMTLQIRPVRLDLNGEDGKEINVSVMVCTREEV